MKFCNIPASAVFDENLTDAEFRTLAALCYFGSNEQKGSWYSYRVIAERLEKSRRAIINHISKLESYFYISKEIRTREDGGNTSNLYKINYNIAVNIVKQDNLSSEANNTTIVNETSPLIIENKKIENNKNNNINIITKKMPKKPVKLALEEWEKQAGAKLCIQMMANWVKANNFDENKIRELIEKYRISVQAGGNVYANHVAAFKKWLSEGYFKVTPEQIKKQKQQDDVIFYDKGIRL